jgi:hypothetical protein
LLDKPLSKRGEIDVAEHEPDPSGVCWLCFFGFSAVGAVVPGLALLRCDRDEGRKSVRPGTYVLVETDPGHDVYLTLPAVPTWSPLNLYTEEEWDALPRGGPEWKAHPDVVRDDAFKAAYERIEPSLRVRCATGHWLVERAKEVGWGADPRQPGVFDMWFVDRMGRLIEGVPLDRNPQ